MRPTNDRYRKWMLGELKKEERRKIAEKKAEEQRMERRFDSWMEKELKELDKNG